MQIRQILNQHRNDFSAIMQCEHCSHEWKNQYGYDDRNYYENVIPHMHCQKCGKDSSGQVLQVDLGGDDASLL